MAFTKINAAGIGSTELVTLHSLEVLNNATVGGVLTYEDVTNVDSIGLITARNGIVVGSGITLSKDGDIFATGITTVSGNVKVGTGITLSPDGHIFTTGISTFGGNVQLSGTDPEIELNNGGPRFRVPSANTLTIHTGSGLGSANEERLRITSDGKVGINQNTPTADLEVAPNGTGTTSTIFINAPTHNTSVASEAVLKFGYGHSGSPEGEGHIKMVENGGNAFDAHFIFGLPTNNGSGGSVTNEKMRLRSDGLLGIGTNIPNSYDQGGRTLVLDQSGTFAGITIRSSQQGSIYFADGLTGNEAYRGRIEYKHASDSLDFGTSGSATMLRITSTGEVGINVDDPDAKLEVRDSGATGIIIRSTQTQATDANKAIRVRNNSDTDTFSVSHKGKVFPLDNIVMASGKGIDFGATGDAGGMSSEVLDDYEEGTWTARFYPNSSSFSASSYDLDAARYTKIGNVVYWAFRIRISSFSGGGGNLEISGLPYTVGAGYPQTTCHLHASNWASNTPKNIVYKNSLTRMDLYYESGSLNSASPTNPVPLSSLQANSYLIGQGFYYV